MSRTIINTLIASAAVAANADNTDLIGDTPLLIAVQEGHTDVVRILVDNDAKVNARDTFGGTSIGYATARGHREVVNVPRTATLNQERGR